jgi:hypothetical protein
VNNIDNPALKRWASFFRALRRWRFERVEHHHADLKMLDPALKRWAIV